MVRFSRVAAHAVPLTVGALLLTTGVSAAQPSTVDAAAARTEAGINALQSIKKSLSPAERKQSSQLVVEKRLRADRSLAAKLPEYRSGVGVSNAGTVSVDIAAQGKAVANAVKAAGGTVRYAAPDGAVRADLPLSALDAIAGRADVTEVKPAAQATTWSEQGNRDFRKAASAQAAAAATQVSEGDKAHGADTARTTYGVSGSGVKVCVLSDGVDSLAKSQAAGELPAVDVLSGQKGSGDEGTAMLEIIHDLAPNATLGFATAFTSEASFAANIRALRTTGNCKVIVDDVSYFDESPFQDTQVAQAVNDVTAAGVLYFSSAGNSGNATDGTSGYYEGDFRASSSKISGVTGTPHDFDPSSTTQNFDALSAGSLGKPVTLFWSDPWGKSANDYDLFILNSSGRVVASSENAQSGSQNPYEIASVPTTGSGYKVAVVKYSGADRFIALNVIRGRFVASGSLKAFSTNGVTNGHSAAVNAFSVAAAPAAGAFTRPLETGDPANPAGPYPGLYTASSKWERFSSDGKRRLFYNVDGTAITPGNVSSTGGTVRNKPDITAADGVATSVAGFQPFFGTSAAAPHAAAIAALLLSGKPAATPAQIRTALVSSAIDLGTPGFDTVTGNGVIMAGPALAALGVAAK
ncbi:MULTISPECIES: S8 family serine peptidase [unclassified Amycolatopsis]|uniref:S8 family peptidase n=1 Tax=unclassified Amycolatopsis TaxID=2618356 RepID=UPI00287437D3|nr:MULTISPECIES: S8 family serine peptidase [unclassified Amycolatopsis]MDS0135520.1 S8 family serine peptidase [Amycolatopsis sp. 505]MDS0140789.1 S8 family serine peptidase [Amycolatopsis sp. CM201R]